MKLVDIIFYIFFIIMICIPFVLVLSPNVRNVHFGYTEKQSLDPYLIFVENNSVWSESNFTYAPHYVMFHIVPEGEGIFVYANPDLGSYKYDVKFDRYGFTNNESEVALPMFRSIKYEIDIADANRYCEYWIYPTDDKYEVECPLS